METLDRTQLEQLVREVLNKLQPDAISPPTVSHSSPSSPKFIYESIDAACDVSSTAQELFQNMGLEFRKNMITAIREAAKENAQYLAKLAWQETSMGRWEHKVQKNILVAEKTPGVEDIQPVIAYTGDKGLTLVEYAPFGVVAAVTPSTNPTATIINNSISILSGGNSVIFAPHPAAKKSSQEAMRIINQAIASVGAPSGLVTTFEPITHETTKQLLQHPKVKMYIVTGGPGIVKVAMTIGKPCKIIAAGPGNPPVIIDEYAEFPKCAYDVITGASFDNCILCTGEKEVIVVDKAWDRFLQALRADSRAYELTTSQMNEVAKKVIIKGGIGCKEPVLNREYVGKNASVIAKAIDLNIPDSVMLLWGIVPNDDVFIWTEQLMPVLPVTKVPDIDSAIDLAVKCEGDNHHTASIYSLNVANITKAARTLACSIFVKNGPNFMGLGLGEGFATMSIGTPTGDGLTKPTHFVRPLHCTMVGYLRIA